MGDDEVMSQADAWRAYDRWMEDGRIMLIEEPRAIEPAFRAMTRKPRPAPKDWADSYLAAFAVTGGLRLVTFDQGFRGKIRDLLVLTH
jgi:predicted nucleic acid-binding protein